MSTAPVYNPVTIVDVIRALKQSPIYFITWFMFFFLLVVAAYFIIPRKYLSEGKFYVQVGRSSVGAGSETSSGMVVLQDSRATEVKSVVGMLESRQMAARVADVVGPDEILRPSSKIGQWMEDLPIDKVTSQMDQISSLSKTDEEVPEPNELSADEKKRLKRRDKAIKQLMQEVDVEHEKSTTVVALSVKAQSPMLAQKIIDAYLSEYQKLHIEINKLQSSSDFFDDQYELKAKTVENAERELEALRTSLDALTIGGKRETKQMEINQLALDRASTIVKLGEADRKARQFARELATIPQFISGLDTKISSLASDRSREALYQQEILLAEAESDFTENDPRLRSMRERYRKAKAQFQAIPKSFSQKEDNVSLAHQEVQVLLSSAIAEAQGLRTRLSEIDRLLSENKTNIRSLNDAEVKSNLLVAKIRNHRSALEIIAMKRAENETLRALDTQSVSNVKVAQPAALILKKVFPSGAMFGLLGLVFSLFMASVMTFFRNFELQLDRPITGQRYQQRVLDESGGGELAVDSRSNRRRRDRSSRLAANEQPVVTARSPADRPQVNIIWLISTFCMLLIGFTLVSIFLI